MMARYVIRERLRDPAGLKDFNAHGYYFSAEQSGPDQLVFLRGRPARLISPARRLAGRSSFGTPTPPGALPFVPPTPLLRRLSPQKKPLWRIGLLNRSSASHSELHHIFSRPAHRLLIPQ